MSSNLNGEWGATLVYFLAVYFKVFSWWVSLLSLLPIDSVRHFHFLVENEISWVKFFHGLKAISFVIYYFFVSIFSLPRIRTMFCISIYYVIYHTKNEPRYKKNIKRPIFTKLNTKKCLYLIETKQYKNETQVMQAFPNIHGSTIALVMTAT